MMNNKTYRKYATIVASLLLPLLAFQQQSASAAPISGRIGVMPSLPYYGGGEAIVHAEQSPVSLGLQGLYVQDSYAQYTIWAQFSHHIAEQRQVGLVLGVNQSWNALSQPMAGTDKPGFGPPVLGYVVGASLQQQWGPLRIQATPNYTFVPGFLNYLTLREALISGLPWLEVGYKVAPSFEVSIGASVLPLKASWLF